jgi:hypothetical protein
MIRQLKNKCRHFENLRHVVTVFFLKQQLQNIFKKHLHDEFGQKFTENQVEKLEAQF